MAELSEAVGDALRGIEAAVEAAARRRAQIVRELASMPAPQRLSAGHRALVEALLRREAADADAGATPQDRAARVLDESRRAREARRSLGEAAADDAERAHLERLDAANAELEATWHWALDQADGFAVRLQGRAPAEVAGAVGGYVAAFREVLRASESLDPDEIGRAVANAETAGARLERALT